MKTDGLPLSERVEDRRTQPQPVRPVEQYTLNEVLQRATSHLAKDAGVDDLK